MNTATGSKPPHGRQTHAAPSPSAFQADFWQGQLGTGDTTTARLPPHLSNPRGQITHTQHPSPGEKLEHWADKP